MTILPSQIGPSPAAVPETIPAGADPGPGRAAHRALPVAGDPGSSFSDPGFSDPGFPDPGFSDSGGPDAGRAESGHPDPARRDPARSDPAARQALWAALAPYAPNRRALERGRIVAFETGPGAIPFDMMRTRLVQQMRARGWRRVAITSPSSACGKTMTCLNLAFSLSRQPDLHTMVVELDLRRPTMRRTLGLREEYQFASALQGSDPPEAHMLRHGANLAFAPSASPVPNPAELLQGVGAAAVLDTLEARYAPDVMIFDMPPMLMTDDTMAFIDQADCTLLVAAAGVTSAEDLRRCRQDLEGRTNLLGVVLNKCQYLDRSERYGYYY